MDSGENAMKHKSGIIMGVVLASAFVFGWSAAAFAQAPVTTEDLNQFSWRWVGPAAFSGRITEFAVPRGQSQAYYVLTASGGLWKTEDGGIHFEPLFDKYGNMSMGYLAIAPSDPNILYLGTGEPMHARASAHGNGVWKSTDAGKTWTRIGLEKSFFIPKIAVDAKNPDVVYVAAEGKLYDNDMDCERGLYKSTDGGKTWTNVFLTAGVKDRGVGDFVIDPGRSDVIIAAAYKTFRRTWTYIDRQPGNLLYKSTDGGRTWKALTAGLPVSAELGRTGLAIYEKDPQIVYARLDEEVNLGLAGRDGGANFRQGGFGGNPGLWADGFNWTRFKTCRIDTDMAKQAPKFTPFKAENEADLIKKLNEAVGDKDFLSKNGVDIVRFNAAARKTYAGDKDIAAAIDEIEKVMKQEAPKPDSAEAKGRSQLLNRHVLEILYAKALAGQQPVKRSGVVYRSADQGETWKRATEYALSGGSAQVNQTEGGYYGRIYIDPANDKVLFCVDTNVTISTDGGKTFKASGWDMGSMKTHVDHRGAWIDPLNSKHILSGNDGGVCESWDGGKHWSQKNTISAQQFYDVAADNELPYNVMGGTQDNGAWLGPSQNRNQFGVFAADWSYLPTGDGFYVVRDWWNPEYVYYESQFGSSSRTNMKTGETIGLAKRWTAEETAAGAVPLRYQWNAPIVLSPHNPGIVYIASQYVWRSLSRGAQGSWQQISPDLTKADKDRIALSKKTNLQYATVYAFAESAKKPGLYWAGTDDGNLQMSPDGGVNWVNITARFYDAAGKPRKNMPGALIPYDRWVKSVVPSAFDEKTCYVAFNGYRTHNEDKTYVFVTRDLGRTWEDLSAGMNNPVYRIKEDPDNADVLYLATDYGVYITFDKGKNWTNFSSAAPNVIIRDIDIQKRERELVIGTYGRGIYIADIFPLKEFKAENFQKDAYLFDIKDVTRWNRMERRGETLGELARVDNPAINASMYYYLKAEAKTVTLLVKDLEGQLIQEVTGPSKKGLQKAVWTLSRRADPNAQPQAGGGRGGRGGLQAENGIYKVTLNVDGKDIATKKVALLPDPAFK
jgi:photosystem II stability/assembly factor-like uncharacterized protein